MHSSEKVVCSLCSKPCQSKSSPMTKPRSWEPLVARSSTDRPEVPALRLGYVYKLHPDLELKFGKCSQPRAGLCLWRDLENGSAVDTSPAKGCPKQVSELIRSQATV